MAKKTVKGTCAICGEEITGKMKTMATGEMICAECLEESAEIVECETCHKLFWAKDVIRCDSDTLCLECAKEVAETNFAWNYHPYDATPDEDGEVETLESWMEGAREEIDTWSGRKLRKIGHKLLDEGMGWKEDVA